MKKNMKILSGFEIFKKQQISLVSQNLVCLLFISLFGQQSIEAIELPSIFSDGMILQRNQPLPVWGWASAGSSVTVIFAGETQITQANAEGQWRVTLSPLKASTTGRDMVVIEGKDSVIFKNILVGEVWFCSGQSNMDFILSRIAANAMEEKYQPIADEVTKQMNTVEDNLFRQFTVNKNLSASQPLDRHSGNWIIATSSKNNGNFTAVGFFYGLELRAKLNVPVGLINCAWGGTRIEPWMPKEAFFSDPDLEQYYNSQVKSLIPKLDKWDQDTVDKNYSDKLSKWEDKEKVGARPSKPTDPARGFPSAIYNAMVHPVIPYGIRGVIWYQGESNRNHYAKTYAQRFEAMVKYWRDVWGQGDFPVYYVQLASFGAKGRNLKAYSKGWPIIQDQQRRALSIKNTGMIVANDIGEMKDIHPRNKIDVGNRLALLALENSYDYSLVYNGPLYEKHEICEGKVVVHFSHSGSGLMTGEKNLLDPVKEIDVPLGGFEIRGTGQDWMEAQAIISGLSEVVVSHPDCPVPTEVRYAWSMFPEKANLYNHEGLPASIFNTVKNPE